MCNLRNGGSSFLLSYSSHECFWFQKIKDHALSPSIYKGKVRQILRVEFFFALMWPSNKFHKLLKLWRMQIKSSFIYSQRILPQNPEVHLKPEKVSNFLHVYFFPIFLSTCYIVHLLGTECSPLPKTNLARQTPMSLITWLRKHSLKYSFYNVVWKQNLDYW